MNNKKADGYNKRKESGIQLEIQRNSVGNLTEMNC